DGIRDWSVTGVQTCALPISRKNKAAIIWEGEPGDTRVLRFQDLQRDVCKFSSALKKLGIKPGDRVTIYMPMIPEAVIAMLGCARSEERRVGKDWRSRCGAEQ